MFRRKSAKSTRRATAPGSATPGNGPVKAKELEGNRSKSVPTIIPKTRRRKGIMKYVTADDSLHSKYGGNETNKESTSDESETETKRVVLKDIRIREYARTIGDNPSCSSGPPMSISWEYDPDATIISVDQYEESRPPRRTHFEMVLPRDIRQSMLKKEWDVSQGQIAAAVRQNIKIKNQRRSTVNNIGKTGKMEEMMESASRKVFRGLLLKKSTGKQVQDLEKQISKAEKARAKQQLDEQMADEYDINSSGADDNDDHEDTIEPAATATATDS